MTYAKGSKVERYEEVLDEHLKEVRSLKPGERIIINCAGEKEATRVRYMLYDWLHSRSLKGAFKIKRLSRNELLLQRKESLSQLIRHSEKLDNRIGTFIEALIEVWETPEAKQLLETWKADRTVTEEEALTLWNKVEKIMN
jgi:thioredoxin-like negative regulator of GroEL